MYVREREGAQNKDEWVGERGGVERERGGRCSTRGKSR